MKLMCCNFEMRGVLGREAPQNTSHLTVRTHKGSEKLSEAFCSVIKLVFTDCKFLIYGNELDKDFILSAPNQNP